MSEPRFTHLDHAGNAQVVDVTEKSVTSRIARAQAIFSCAPAVIALIRDAVIPKGDVLAVSRIAGIMAAKKTSELIPLCHPLALTGITVNFEIHDADITIIAEVKTTDRTGVEMEALTAVSVAALSMHDMTKALDPYSRIDDIKVLYKSGGRSGEMNHPQSHHLSSATHPNEPS